MTPEPFWPTGAKVQRYVRIDDATVEVHFETGWWRKREHRWRIAHTALGWFWADSGIALTHCPAPVWQSLHNTLGIAQ